MLEWTEECDGNDNTIYEAPGVYTDECGGPQFYYRIKPLLLMDQIVFTTEGTDEELLSQIEQRSFGSVEAAKAYCEENHAERCRQCAAHQEQA